MKDGFQRQIEYLRISLTDKCNLRCGYCMPREGIKHISHEDMLSFEEIQRLVFILTGMGVKRVRLTGGEPLIRRGVTDLVGMLTGKGPGSEGPGREAILPGEVHMTTNGCMLSDMAKPLKEAGLSGVNISLDTLNPETFEKLTGKDELGNVLKGIDAALDVGLNVKLNCVPIRGINDNEIADLVGFAEKKGIVMRFIELMPIGCGSALTGIPSSEVRDILKEKYGEPVQAKYGESSLEEIIGGSDTENDSGRTDIKGPAVYYRFPGCREEVGFITPVSHRFCDRCNRIRLTAEGFLKLCLQYPDGIDLRKLIRSGASDEDIKAVIEGTVMNKKEAHCFGNYDVSDKRNMIQIGG